MSCDFCVLKAEVFPGVMLRYLFCTEACHFLSLDFICNRLGAIARLLSAYVERHIQVYFGHGSDHASTLLHCSDFVGIEALGVVQRFRLVHEHDCGRYFAHEMRLGLSPSINDAIRD